MIELPIINQQFSESNKPSCSACPGVCCHDFGFKPKSYGELEKVLLDGNRIFEDRLYNTPYNLKSKLKTSEQIKIIFGKLYYLKGNCVHFKRGSCNDYENRYTFCRDFKEGGKRCIDVSNQRNKNKEVR